MIARQFLAFSNPGEFLAQIESFLMPLEARESLILGLAAANHQAGRDLRAWAVTEASRTVLASLQTPTYPLILSHSETRDAVRYFAQKMVEQNRGLVYPSVVGPVSEVQTFTDEWTRLTQEKFRLGYNQRILQMKTLVPARATPGQARPSAQADLELVSDWLQSFVQEAIPEEAIPLEERRKQVEGTIERGLLFLWELGGQPVALAGVGRPTKNGISVNAVYTPPASRGHGYASALVSWISREQLAKGKKFCVLYTDLANATANSIYEKLGYQHIADSLMMVRMSAPPPRG